MFLSPWFLLGLGAVGLPVWLHLLRQHRSTPLPFASLMFFEQRITSSVKHRRLKYLLLFALRTLLLVLLALAFANPFRITEAAGAGAKDKIVVLALDNSFSMRQGDRFERAKQEALRAAAALKSGDRGRVVALGNQAVLMNEPTADPAALRAAVAAVTPGDGRGSYAELARALRAIAQSARRPVEAHLFSDMQKSGWPANFADAQLGEGITLVLHPVAKGRQANFAVETVNAPRRVYDPKKVRIQATITGFGTEKASRKVSLLVNGKELDAKTVEVGAGGRTTVEFLKLDVSYGLNRGEIRITPPDDFPADDRYHFSLERSDPRRVLFVTDGRSPRALTYFQTALEAASDGAFTLDTVRPEQAIGAGLGKYALIVMSDVAALPQDSSEALRAWVRGGGAVWIALGRGVTAGTRIAVLDETVAESRYSPRDGDRFRTVAFADPGHPAVRSQDRFAGVKFFQSAKVASTTSKVLARLTDESPVLLEKAVGEGRAMLFTSGFDNLSNDFPVHAGFVPFVVETARYLARLEEGVASYPVGAFFELRTAKERGAAVEVLDPQGKRALTLDEATRVETLMLAQEGFYDVRRPSGRHELAAVNADRHESDLEVLPSETLALWQNTGQGGVASGPAGVAPDKRVEPFWWYLLWLALALSLAETIVGNRHLAVERDAS